MANYFYGHRANRHPNDSFLGAPKLRGLGLGFAVCLLPGLAFAQIGPELAVLVTGRHQTLEGMPTENAVFLQLSVSDSAGANGATTSSSSGEFLRVEVDNEPEPNSYGEIPLDPLERDEPVGLSSTERAVRRGRDVPTQTEAAKSHAPFVLSTVFVLGALDAALSSQGIQGSLGRLDGLVSRSRYSALLPEVRFRAGRNADQSLRLAPTADDPYRYTQSGGVAYIVEGTASFRLNRLLFANEELGIERLRLAQVRERQRLTELLLAELFVWQKAYRIMAEASLASGRAQSQLRESSLRLDVMTGGWFSEHEPALPTEPRGRNLTAPTTPVVEPAVPNPPRPRRDFLPLKQDGGPCQAGLAGVRAGDGA